MNNTESVCTKPNSCEISSEYIPAASHFALKLAFKTLKERCDKLQSRLCVVEEENLRLKEHGGKKECSDKDRARIDILEKRIDDLSRQKSQLSHHIFMLANENKNLWDSISKLTEEKQILLGQIRDLDSKLNGTEKKESLDDSSNFFKKDAEDTVGCSIRYGYSTENASDEDDKGSLQSIETVKDFTLERHDNGLDLVGINNEMKNTLDKLDKDKSQLQQQQASLKKVLESMKKIYLGMKLFSMYMQRLKTDSEESSDKSQDKIKKRLEKLIHYSKEISLSCQDLEGVEDINELICPFCNKPFVKDTLSEEHDHFLKHVQDCSDTDNVLKSFEVV